MCKCNKTLDLKFVKTRDVKSPEKGTLDSAGIDFFVPNDSKEIWIYPKDVVIIKSGIHVKIPKGYCLLAQNKSGIAVKTGLKYSAGLIDEDYQGEIGIVLNNPSKRNIIVKPGMKIIQFIMVPVPKLTLMEVDELSNLYPKVSERGDGGYGSTGIY